MSYGAPELMTLNSVRGKCGSCLPGVSNVIGAGETTPSENIKAINYRTMIKNLGGKYTVEKQLKWESVIFCPSWGLGVLFFPRLHLLFKEK